MAGGPRWFSRGQRLLVRRRPDCVSAGYLLIPALLEQVFGGDFASAVVVAEEIADPSTLPADQRPRRARTVGEDHAFVRQGRVAERAAARRRDHGHGDHR